MEEEDRPSEEVGRLGEEEVLPQAPPASLAALASEFAAFDVALADIKRDWTERIVAIQRLEGLVKGGAAAAYGGEWVDLVWSLRKALRTQLTDLRSKIPKAMASLLTVMATSREPGFGRLADYLLGDLLLMLAETNKSIRLSATKTLTVVVTSVRLTGEGLLKITSSLDHKSRLLRSGATELLALVLSTYELEVLLDSKVELAVAIRKSLCDADPTARANGKKAFAALVAVFPLEAQGLLPQVDSVMQKALAPLLRSTSTCPVVSSLCTSSTSSSSFSSSTSPSAASSSFSSSLYSSGGPPSSAASALATTAAAVESMVPPLSQSSSQAHSLYPVQGTTNSELLASSREGEGTDHQVGAGEGQERNTRRQGSSSLSTALPHKEPAVGASGHGRSTTSAVKPWHKAGASVRGRGLPSKGLATTTTPSLSLETVTVIELAEAATGVPSIMPPTSSRDVVMATEGASPLHAVACPESLEKENVRSRNSSGSAVPVVAPVGTSAGPSSSAPCDKLTPDLEARALRLLIELNVTNSPLHRSLRSIVCEATPGRPLSSNHSSAVLSGAVEGSLVEEESRSSCPKSLALSSPYASPKKRRASGDAEREEAAGIGKVARTQGKLSPTSRVIEPSSASSFDNVVMATEE